MTVVDVVAIRHLAWLYWPLVAIARRELFIDIILVVFLIFFNKVLLLFVFAENDYPMWYQLFGMLTTVPGSSACLASAFGTRQS